ncbi:5-(carboxyamino)imidazole ribonucleotide synthase [Janibacter indicus]|uniref:N5-carboxyaminoimidazole ribonucleotide synthase n=1 Tax=Janibacter indicus TaxID=857417 RepID=A0A7L9IX51_9MICO|nr:5-(carboxyamino)imidazole ribonucleotide synthase [Janibacter indicus]QOK21971.1 5-(carboxyamino)imidazole ribonucleotide synthase [Janibacter indicus]
MSTPPRAPGGFPVVGVIGGGQLARMCAGPAAELSITLAVLAEAPDAAAALVTPFAPVGDHTDVATVRDFARHCDVVTFDHEHVPSDVLEALVADGVAVHPTPQALRHAQDKLVMRRALTGAGVPCPRWAAARSEADVVAFGDETGWPLVVKTPRGGYDGKGVLVADTVDDVRDWLAAAAERDEELLLEEAVPFVRELAVLLARSPSGQAAAWPVVETVQTDGICTEVIAPAPDLAPEAAEAATLVGLDIAAALGVTGVMAVELFELADGSVVVNELAMRPHNSGHWSMDGAVTGQFEQHLRAVLDLPLGSPRAREQWTVMGNVLGGEPTDIYPTYRHLMARDPELKVHLYGKGVRPGRKIGHVNVSGTDLTDLRERARHAADYIQGVIVE